jgi:Mrp family chromosome partitioning ATPase
MSATDNAFIKIYTHDDESGVPRPAMAGAAHRSSTASGNRRLRMSKLAAAANGTSPPLALPPLESPQEASLERSSAHQVPSTPTDRDSLGATVSNGGAEWSDHVRPDGPHAMMSPPHVAPDRFQTGNDEQGDLIETESSDLFRPAWEVDRFHWPPICEQLQRDWASPLTGIVRSVIREAWRGANVVAVTQFGRSEGSTTLALCLARIAASFHVRVAVVDGNRQNPDVALALGLKCESGWELTRSDRPLEEAAVGSVEDGLVVLPMIAPASEPSVAIESESRADLLERLSGAFELVVLDAGPIFVAAHDWFSPPCVSKVGSALIVRDVRCTEAAQVEDVCCRLRGAGVGNMSVVENFQFE